MYSYTYFGRWSYICKIFTILGIGHADDLQYVMPGLWYGTQLSQDDPDIFMVNRLTQLWTSFARTG